MKVAISTKNPKVGKTTYRAKSSKRWFLIDAKNKTLGRMASSIANILTGKHSTNFAPNMNHGDGVIVINARNIFVSGNKRNKKSYYKYSNYIGSDKEIPFSIMIDKHPERVIMKAVKGMLSKGPLANEQLKNLRVFADKEHDLTSQQPEILA